MTSFRSVDQQLFVEKTAQELKTRIEMPAWAQYIKTGVSRDRAPHQKDWWYLRAASILRKAAQDEPVGVSRLRSYYGGLHRRGHKPAHFAKGGGKIVRVMLQDLEKAGLLGKDEKKKGRVVTSEGKKFLTGIAKSLK